MEGFKLEMEQELQTLRFELEDEGKAMLGILFSNLKMSPKPLFLLMQIYMHVCVFVCIITLKCLSVSFSVDLSVPLKITISFNR